MQTKGYNGGIHIRDTGYGIRDTASFLLRYGIRDTASFLLRYGIFSFKIRDKCSGKRDSNPQPLRWQRNTLPLSYSRLFFIQAKNTKKGEALTGKG